MHNFNPTYIDGEAVVKRIDNNYSTHIPPFNFEIDESKDIFICGEEYIIDELKAIELYESGYGEFITPPVIIPEEPTE